MSPNTEGAGSPCHCWVWERSAHVVCVSVSSHASLGEGYLLPGTDYQLHVLSKRVHKAGTCVYGNKNLVFSYDRCLSISPHWTVLMPTTLTARQKNLCAH